MRIVTLRRLNFSAGGGEQWFVLKNILKEKKLN